MYWGLKGGNPINADSWPCHEILDFIQNGPGYTVHNNKFQQFHKIFPNLQSKSCGQISWKFATSGEDLALLWTSTSL